MEVELGWEMVDVGKRERGKRAECEEVVRGTGRVLSSLGERMGGGNRNDKYDCFRLRISEVVF